MSIHRWSIHSWSIHSWSIHRRKSWDRLSDIQVGGVEADLHPEIIENCRVLTSWLDHRSLDLIARDAHRIRTHGKLELFVRLHSQSNIRIIYACVAEKQ